MILELQLLNGATTGTVFIGLSKPSLLSVVPPPQHWQWQYTDAISRVFVQQCVGQDDVDRDLAAD
jgi:hypothetical protein